MTIIIRLLLAASLLVTGTFTTRVEATGKSGVRGPVPPEGTQGPVGQPVLPDLVPVTDGGKRLSFQSRTEHRYAFWVKNMGPGTTGPSRIRLKFYHRPGWQTQNPQWTMHANIHLDVPALNSKQESRALVARLLYSRAIDFNLAPSFEMTTLYKFEFTVDDLKQVNERNETNNVMVTEKPHHKHDALETGPSGGFH